MPVNTESKHMQHWILEQVTLTFDSSPKTTGLISPYRLTKTKPTGVSCSIKLSFIREQMLCWQLPSSCHCFPQTQTCQTLQSFQCDHFVFQIGQEPFNSDVRLNLLLPMYHLKLKGEHQCNTRTSNIVQLLLFFSCLMSQQQASVSQGPICSGNCTCCHTDVEVADQTFYLTQSQYTDTGPTSTSADPATPVPGRVATEEPNFKSSVWLNLEKFLQRKPESNP